MVTLLNSNHSRCVFFFLNCTAILALSQISLQCLKPFTTHRWLFASRFSSLITCPVYDRFSGGTQTWTTDDEAVETTEDAQTMAHEVTIS